MTDTAPHQRGEGALDGQEPQGGVGGAARRHEGRSDEAPRVVHRHDVVGALTLTSYAGGARCGHGREHRHAAAGRTGHAGSASLAGRP